jgi:hypothetical protein
VFCRVYLEICVKFNLSNTIHFLKFTWFLYVLSKYHGCSWNAMFWDIHYSKNSNVISRFSVFIGHASRPTQRIVIQLNAIKFGLKIILIYWHSITNFVYAITINIFKIQKSEMKKRTTFGELVVWPHAWACYYVFLSLDWQL